MPLSSAHCARTAGVPPGRRRSGGAAGDRTAPAWPPPPPRRSGPSARWWCLQRGLRAVAAVVAGQRGEHRVGEQRPAAVARSAGGLAGVGRRRRRRRARPARRGRAAAAQRDVARRGCRPRRRAPSTRRRRPSPSPAPPGSAVVARARPCAARRRRRGRRRTPRTCAAPARRGHGYLLTASSDGPGQVEAGGARPGRPPWPPGGSAPAASARCPRSRRTAASVVQRVLAVVPERRVAEIVGEPGGVDHVRVAAQPRPPSRGRSARPPASGSAGYAGSRRCRPCAPGSSRPAAGTPPSAAPGRGPARTPTARDRCPSAARRPSGRRPDHLRPGRLSPHAAAARRTRCRPGRPAPSSPRVALTHVDVAGAHVDQPLDLGILVVGTELDVQPVLGRLVVGDRHEEQSPAARSAAPADLHLVRLLVRRPGSPAPRPTSGRAGRGPRASTVRLSQALLMPMRLRPRAADGSPPARGLAAAQPPQQSRVVGRSPTVTGSRSGVAGGSVPGAER